MTQVRIQQGVSFPSKFQVCIAGKFKLAQNINLELPDNYFQLPNESKYALSRDIYFLIFLKHIENLIYSSELVRNTS